MKMKTIRSPTRAVNEATRPRRGMSGRDEAGRGATRWVGVRRARASSRDPRPVHSSKPNLTYRRPEPHSGTLTVANTGDAIALPPEGRYAIMVHRTSQMLENLQAYAGKASMAQLEFSVSPLSMSGTSLEGKRK
jgi:hypothetical protein